MPIGFTVGMPIGLWMVSVGVVMPAPAPKEEAPSTPFIEWAITDDFTSNSPHDPLVVKDNVIVGTDKGELVSVGKT